MSVKISLTIEPIEDSIIRQLHIVKEIVLGYFTALPLIDASVAEPLKLYIKKNICDRIY